MLHGSSTTWFQTSRYCRAEVHPDSTVYAEQAIPLSDYELSLIFLLSHQWFEYRKLPLISPEFSKQAIAVLIKIRFVLTGFSQALTSLNKIKFISIH